MKEKFENRKLTGSIKVTLTATRVWEADKAEVIRNIVGVVEDYSSQGYKLTLRQLYYQLVARDYIPNHDKVYKKLSSILDDCRYSGVIDWDDIEDRGRVPYTPYYEDDINDAIMRTYRSYRLDKRRGQKTYVELWTEKDAISNILKGALKNFTITLGVNKGFTSSTSIHNAYERFVEEMLERKKVVLLYFGDHDPSGLDMVRDIKARLELMISQGDNREELIELYEDDEDCDVYRLMEIHGLEDEYDDALADENSGNKWEYIKALAVVRELFEVKHIGLTKEQIEQFNLPPNPAKLTDPRAKNYVMEHGNISWEVDALQPEDLKDIIQEELEQVIDMEQYDVIVKQEQQEREQLFEIAQKFKSN